MQRKVLVATVATAPLLAMAFGAYAETVGHDGPYDADRHGDGDGSAARRHEGRPPTAPSSLTTAGAMVTLDSNNKVTNLGTLATVGVDNSTGVLIQGGTTGSVTNNATSSPDRGLHPDRHRLGRRPRRRVRQGPNRYGIRLTGPGVFTGDIVQRLDRLDHHRGQQFGRHLAGKRPGRQPDHRRRDHRHRRQRLRRACRRPGDRQGHDQRRHDGDRPERHRRGDRRRHQRRLRGPGQRLRHRLSLHHAPQPGGRSRQARRRRPAAGRFGGARRPPMSPAASCWTARRWTRTPPRPTKTATASPTRRRHVVAERPPAARRPC
jgi:hypothetical protein